MKKALALPLLVLSLAFAACGGDGAASEDGTAGPEPAPAGEAATTPAPDRVSTDLDTKPSIKVPDAPPPGSLETEDIVEGDGAAAEAGDELEVQYVGVSYATGEEFDSSWERGEPFAFRLGDGMVIPGWDQGLEGMKVGGRRRLTIPPDLAYGAQGSPPAIGPNETLVFVIDLVDSK